MRTTIIKILILLFLAAPSHAATWDLPDTAGEKKLWDVKENKWDRPRGAFEQQEIETGPPKGWYWWRNAEDFPVPGNWNKWAQKRFKSLIADETIPEADRKYLKTWETPVLQANTRFAEVHGDPTKNYVHFKADRFTNYTVFKIEPSEGIVEQNFQGEAKIYGLKDGVSYRVSCHDATGPIGHYVTAIRDKYIRAELPGGTSDTAAMSVLVHPKDSRTIYFTANVDSAMRIYALDSKGDILWNYDANDILDPGASTKVNTAIWSSDGYILWVVSGEWFDGSFLRKIDVHGTTIWEADIDVWYFDSLADLSNPIAEGPNEYVVTTKLGLAKINKENGAVSHWTLNDDPDGSNTYSYWPYIGTDALFSTRDKDIIVATIDDFAYKYVDYRSGATLESGHRSGYPPRLIIEDRLTCWMDELVSTYPYTGYVGFDLGTGNSLVATEMAYRVGWYSGYAACDQGTATLQGSNNASSWTNLSSFDLTGLTATTYLEDTATFANSTAYRYYRLNFTNVQSSLYDGVSGLQPTVYHLSLSNGTWNGPGAGFCKLQMTEGTGLDLAGRWTAKGCSAIGNGGAVMDGCLGYRENTSLYALAGYTSGNADTFVVAWTDEGGNESWGYTYDVGGYPRSISPTEDKGFIISGSDGDPDSSWSTPTAFLLKIDSNGKEEWRKTFKPDGTGTVFYDAVQCDDGGYLAVGGIRYSSSNSAVYIVKTNQHGESCSPGVPCE